MTDYDVLANNTSDGDEAYVDKFRYYLNFWCVFEKEELYGTIFILLCLIENIIIVMMIRRSI